MAITQAERTDALIRMVQPLLDRGYLIYWLTPSEAIMFKPPSSGWAAVLGIGYLVGRQVVSGEPHARVLITPRGEVKVDFAREPFHPATRKVEPQAAEADHPTS